MKKLLLIFFFGTSPLLLISQTISFDDIKMINSKESFDRFVIENNFDNRKVKTWRTTDNQIWGYEQELRQGNEVIRVAFQNYGEFEMQFKFMIDNEKYQYNPSTGVYNRKRIQGEFDATNDYKHILKQVKNQCNFYKISPLNGTYTEVRYTEYDPKSNESIFDFEPKPYDVEHAYDVSYSCYTCPSSKYKGKICFYKGEIIINDPYLN